MRFERLERAVQLLEQRNAELEREVKQLKEKKKKPASANAAANAPATAAPPASALAAAPDGKSVATETKPSKEEKKTVGVFAGASELKLSPSFKDGKTYELRPGDCLVHRAGAEAHTLRAGDDGLDVLAFGQRHYAPGSARLPRAGVSWGLGAWVRTGAEDDHPWQLEVAAGPPDPSLYDEDC